MAWNWQLKEWPRFVYDTEQLRALEDRFLQESGHLSGASLSLRADEQTALEVEFLSDEALETSRIEGEILNRDSLQSSIRRHFGLPTDGRKVSAAEQGISVLLLDVYRQFDSPMDEARLCEWHRQLMRGRWDIEGIGAYRSSAEPMQIVSGPVHQPHVHYEAPPSARIDQEMNAFLDWFEQSRATMPALARSALAHLYFECIHPFEDGNGRMGRALAEISLSQSLGKPVLIPLSQSIANRKKTYYQQLQAASHTLEVTDWVLYFANTILDAQQRAARSIRFLIAKAAFFDRHRGQLNPRQEKVLLRMFTEGPDGFTGGLSASNYASITQASTATVTRDLHDLTEKGALLKTGERKGTRYVLNLP